MQNIKYRAPNAMPIISHKHPIPARSTMTRQRKNQLRQREREHWDRGLVKMEDILIKWPAITPNILRYRHTLMPSSLFHKVHSGQKMGIILNSKNLKDFSGKSNWDFETQLKTQQELWEHASEWQMPAGTKNQRMTQESKSTTSKQQTIWEIYIFPHSKC